MVCIAGDEWRYIPKPDSHESMSFARVLIALVAVQPPFNLISTLIELFN